MSDNKLLPIGSILLLKDSLKKVMVMGFCQTNPEDMDTIYDYCGCLYPEGYMDPQKIFLFNHDMIERVYSVGYIDDEQYEFQDKLEKVVNEIKNGTAEFEEE